MLWASQVLSFMRETCGEVTGLRRPIGSKPRPAQIWEPEIAIYGPDGPRSLEGQMGHQTVPPITQIHPYSPNLGFNGLTNSLAVAAQNGTAEIGRGCLN